MKLIDNKTVQYTYTCRKIYKVNLLTSKEYNTVLVFLYDKFLFEKVCV